MNNKKKCFVIMPVSATKSCTEEEWTGIFEHMIKPAVTGSRLGFDCDRANPRTGAFIRDILDGLNRADVVIADLTDRNPNVCYELGIRHTLRNRTILTAQNIDDIPSDLQSYWVVTYEKDLTGAQQFKKTVREILREMQKAPDKPDSPVADFLQLKNIDIQAYEKSANLKKISSLISEISYNIKAVNSILTQVEENEKARQKGEMGVSYLLLRFSNTCFELLLSTLYIILSKELLEYIRWSNEFIKSINANLEVWPNREEEVEEKFLKHLPTFKTFLTESLKEIGVLMVDYKNDNYQEPKEPIILLASPEHEKYLKITEKAK